MTTNTEKNQLPSGWQPFSTVPRDGTKVDLWNDKLKGRVLGAQFILARDVDKRFAPGGEWESLAQDGFRHRANETSVLVETNLTHWRASELDRPEGS